MSNHTSYRGLHNANYVRGVGSGEGEPAPRRLPGGSDGEGGGTWRARESVARGPRGEGQNTSKGLLSIPVYVCQGVTLYYLLTTGESGRYLACSRR